MKLEDLNNFQSCFTEHTELRYQENSQVSLALVHGNLVRNEKNTSSGISARVYHHGVFGFASSPAVDDNQIQAVIKKSQDNALVLSNLEKRKKKVLSGESFTVIKDFSTKKPRASRKDMIQYLRTLEQYATDKYPGLKSTTFAINNLDMEKALVTSFGAAGYSLIPRTVLMINLSLEKDGVTYDTFEVFGGLGQFEDHFANPEKLYADLDQIYNKVSDKSEGVHAEAGYKDVILDSRLAGILAHEALGHTVEADFVKSGSIAGDYLGEKVASELVTLVDFASEYNGNVCPVPLFMDDEGTKPKDAVIIKDGVLKTFLNNKVLAADLGHEATGNARAYAFSDEPLVRMRNTAFLPGKDRLQDMIASIDDGYYLIKPSNGQADSTSEFMFGVPNGYEIKRGKIGRAIKDTTISGVAFDMLKTITMVSDDMFWSNAGMCGKKQMIPVGMGGPAIKCKINIGGR